MGCCHGNLWRHHEDFLGGRVDDLLSSVLCMYICILYIVYAAMP